MSAPAGWYPDPENPSQQRWWDGQQWGQPAVAQAPVVTASAPQPVGYADLAGQVQQGGQPGKPSQNRGLAISALILGIIALALSWVPFVGLILGIAALVFGFLALKQSKPMAITGLAAGAFAIILFVIMIAVVASNPSSSNSTSGESPAAVDSAEEAPADEEPAAEPAEEPAAAPAGAPGIGDTVTAENGVAFTVTGMECGATTVGEGFDEATAKGQFCVVNITLANNGSEPQTIWVQDITGLIGGSSFEADSMASKFGEDYWTADLNPGLTSEGTLVFDVPAGQKLDTVELDTGWFDQAVAVSVQ
ncbi:DUF4352 domain-containing protein [Agromyces sp. NPDC057679]|uniref:DUF4352 domain-containing protein n=1 Tax=Agromyces sp. NPDC057679 TaxID=3346207 RepID=UPI00366AAD9B